eukprot:RCo004638
MLQLVFVFSSWEKLLLPSCHLRLVLFLGEGVLGCSSERGLFVCVSCAKQHKVFFDPLYWLAAARFSLLHGCSLWCGSLACVFLGQWTALGFMVSYVITLFIVMLLYGKKK